MNQLEVLMKNRASELLSSGEVKRVVAWTEGEFIHDPSPAVFESVEELDKLVYNDFCGANLSKYLIEVSKKEGRTAIFLKPCDSYSFNELVKEHRIKRENILVIAIECRGKLDNYKLAAKGISGITEEEYDGQEVVLKTIYDEEIRLNKSDVLLEKCLGCKGKKHVAMDEAIIIHEDEEPVNDRFSRVRELEAMTAEERYAFWQGELSKCIRCNACRNVCPACTCIKCVFDNPQSGVAAKANDVSFEEQLFHIIRAFHVSGRCTDCGECSRVCPQRIPLHLINRKFIKDIDALYGDFRAGEVAEGSYPLTSYTEKDAEPNDVFNATEGK